MRRNRLGKLFLGLGLMLTPLLSVAKNGSPQDKRGAPEVIVYVAQDNFSVGVLRRAELTAVRILSSIGVPIVFRDGEEPRVAEGAVVRIEMHLDGRVPPSFHPGAMAYSTPFADSGARIHVLCDRVLSPSRDAGTGSLLGHVMAHEIAHILERSDRHSEEGIMKAQFAGADFQQMISGLLRFDPTDTDLIHSALEGRGTRVAWSAPPARQDEIRSRR